MKDEFYNYMEEVKYEIEYYRLYQDQYNSNEKWWNLATGIVSTGSLASLFIWPSIQFILTIILALGQVASSVKPYLWFEYRATELEKLLLQLELMFVEMETQYRYIEEGKLKDHEIVALIDKYKKKIVKLQHECMPKDTLPYKEKYRQKAKKFAEDYLNTTWER